MQSVVHNSPLEPPSAVALCTALRRRTCCQRISHTFRLVCGIFTSRYIVHFAEDSLCGLLAIETRVCYTEHQFNKSEFVILLIYIYAFYKKSVILVPQPFATKEIS